MAVHHPAADIERLADQCVRCGLCLPHCPTYRLDGNEAESPRGRIALARGLVSGRLPPGPVVDGHLDHCLGCLRCETACPAGVRYGELIDATRHLQRHRRGARPWQRAVEWLAAHPALLSRLLGLYRTAFRWLPARLRILPRPPALEPPPAERTAAVALFAGCLAHRYEASTRAGLVKLCRAAGVAVAVPADQTCCGALHRHAGNAEWADLLAARNRRALARFGTVLTLASGCHDQVAAALPEGVTEDALAFLAERRHRLRFATARGRVALHLPCTQHARPGSVAALRQLLAAVPDLDLIELTDTGCCGAAGRHLLDFPERAAALRQPLLDALRRSGADTLLSANIGCRLHLDAAAAVRVTHPIDFLAELLT